MCGTLTHSFPFPTRVVTRQDAGHSLQQPRCGCGCSSGGDTGPRGLRSPKPRRQVPEPTGRHTSCQTHTTVREAAGHNSLPQVEASVLGHGAGHAGSSGVGWQDCRVPRTQEMGCHPLLPSSPAQQTGFLQRPTCPGNRRHCKDRAAPTTSLPGGMQSLGPCECG